MSLLARVYMRVRVRLRSSSPQDAIVTVLSRGREIVLQGGDIPGMRR